MEDTPFRSAYDHLPEHLKNQFTKKAAKINSFAVHAFRDDERGADVIVEGVTGVEALEVLREAVADPQNMSAYATRDRGDGTAQILYLVELEERFQPAE